MIKPIDRNPKTKQAFKLSLAQKLLLIFGLVVLSFTALPTVIILLIGLMPTITTILTDSKNITHALLTRPPLSYKSKLS